MPAKWSGVWERAAYLWRRSVWLEMSPHERDVLVGFVEKALADATVCTSEVRALRRLLRRMAE